MSVATKEKNKSPKTETPAEEASFENVVSKLLGLRIKSAVAEQAYADAERVDEFSDETKKLEEQYLTAYADFNAMFETVGKVEKIELKERFDEWQKENSSIAKADSAKLELTESPVRAVESFAPESRGLPYGVSFSSIGGKPITRSCSVKLTSTEVAMHAKAASKAYSDIENETANLAAITKKFKNKIEDLKLDLKTHTHAVKNESEYRVIPCYETPNYEKSIVELHRHDTGDIIESRQMTQEDRQKFLPFR